MLRPVEALAQRKDYSLGLPGIMLESDDELHLLSESEEALVRAAFCLRLWGGSIVECICVFSGSCT